uniref:HTH CENPB-type domain-containing protein n=1 Tax=Plectus sambesii TaxID=2011161 RepID=A0A914VZL2_9BILA
MNTPKKRSAVTLDVKKAIFEAAAKNNNQTQLAKQFSIPRSTIKDILSRKDAILEAIDGGGESKRARIKTGKYEDLEQALLRWIKTVRSENVPVTGQLLKEKARETSTLLKIEGFKASEGWLTNFKHRHSISFKSNQGEAGAIDVESLGEWQQQVLREELAKFSPDDIFNADETGLFWQLLPNKTLAFKGERCTNGKKSKERITVLVGANMSGTEKLPLLIIGKSAKPRCFKNAHVPLNYTANKKAWMTGDVFETWLKNWDKKLKKDGRKVLLYVDNCTSHPPKIDLKNITMNFFPPNTTAMSQPMDQGIIQNLKVHYRRFLLRERIKAIDEKKDFLINLLNALHLLRRAWDDVKPETVHNCFRKAAFVSNDAMADVGGMPNDEGIDEILNLWENLKVHGYIENDVDWVDYIRIDEEVITGGALSLAEIVEGCSTAVADGANKLSDSEVMDIDDEEAKIEEPAITSLQAQNAMRLVRQYVEKNFADPVLLRYSDGLDNAIFLERYKNQKQRKLTDFFQPTQ